MSNFGLFFFLVQMSWIFACGLRFNRKSQPCIFFRWFALHFRVKTYAKNSWLQDASLVSLFRKTIGFFCLARSTTDWVFCIRFYSKMKRKPAEKNTGLWPSIKSETTCKNSAHLDKKKKQTKIRHRMVMLGGLQLFSTCNILWRCVSTCNISQQCVANMEMGQMEHLLQFLISYWCFFCLTRLASCQIKTCPWPDKWPAYRLKIIYRLAFL